MMNNYKYLKYIIDFIKCITFFAYQRIEYMKKYNQRSELIATGH